MNNNSAQTDTIDTLLLDSMSTAVLAIDETLWIRYANPAAEQLLGMSFKKVLNQRLTRALTIPDALFARVREAMESGQPFTDRQVCVEPHVVTRIKP